MAAQDLRTTIEDHALEEVPAADRKSWVKLAWNTTGLVTTLVIMFFGALACFVAGVPIALAAGLTSFTIGSLLGWALARVAYDTGCSNTLITRRYGLGVRGSALASIIFGVLIIGFLAVENGLLYRGFLFFFGIHDTLANRVLIYGGLTAAWIVLTTFGFMLVTRFSSLMIVAFLAVLVWILWDILATSGRPLGEVLAFGTQVPPAVLERMGIDSAWDKYIFALNILVGPACALALNTADFGRYGRSTADVGIAATLGIFVQSLAMMLAGGVLMYVGADALVEWYAAAGTPIEEARRHVLDSPDSIGATFMVFGGALGFVLMLAAQGKAQVLNTYSSSLCLANLADAAFGLRPGRFVFVVLANVIALAMLYGQILELVEAWIKLMGVLLSALATLIIMDYYVVQPRLARAGGGREVPINWAGVVAVLMAVGTAHIALRPVQPIEVLTSIATVALSYPLLRLKLLRPALAAFTDSEQATETGK